MLKMMTEKNYSLTCDVHVLWQQCQCNIYWYFSYPFSDFGYNADSWLDFIPCQVH